MRSPTPACWTTTPSAALAAPTKWPRSMGELLRAEDVSVQYPAAARAHVNQVSLAVEPGQRMLLLGPSGSGKSTLLRTIAGVVPQTIEAEVTGALHVCGADPRQVPVPE